MAKILVVDDEPMLTEAYCTILEHAGHQTKPAYDGEQALEIAKQFKPDVILLDLLMPKKDGIGFLKEFQLAKKHPKVKVIVFSNLDMQREIEQAYSLGAVRYILKAWATPKALTQIVADTLKNDASAAKASA
mgnify:CR=1 FL=1